VSLLGERTVTRRRFPAGAYVAGRYVAGTPVTDTPVLASVQELSARELQQLPEAERQRDPIKLYTEDTDWQVSDPQTPGQISDRVLVDGRTYKVLTVAPRHSLLPHFKVTAVRVQEQG
jgi:hypothetical protein